MTALPLIVFDVNETLLYLQTMEPTFERIFREKSAMRLWFANFINFIMYSAALTVAGCYVPFTDIGSAVMKMLADTHSTLLNHSPSLSRAGAIVQFLPGTPGSLGRLPGGMSCRPPGDRRELRCDLGRIELGQDAPAKRKIPLVAGNLTEPPPPAFYRRKLFAFYRP
jgi:hypothetical protein